MHTGRKTPKGSQVAWNKCFHNKIALHTNSEGEYYAVTQRIDTPGLIRGEYQPIGVQLVCPVKWGRKRGALHLIDFKIQDAQKQLEDLKGELIKLERCKESILDWENDTNE